MPDVANTGGEASAANDERARAPCLLGVNAWRARRFARVPVRSDAVRRGATRPCVSSGKRLSGSWRRRWRRRGGGAVAAAAAAAAADDAASRSHTHRPTAAISGGYRATGAGRPAGRLQQLCPSVPLSLSLARLDTHAPRECGPRQCRYIDAPMPRRQATLRSRKRVEAISGLGHDTLSREPIKIASPARYRLSHSFSPSIRPSLARAISLRSVTRRTIHIISPNAGTGYIGVHICTRTHT